MTKQEKQELIAKIRKIQDWPTMDDYGAGWNNGINLAIKRLEEFQEEKENDTHIDH